MLWHRCTTLSSARSPCGSAARLSSPAHVLPSAQTDRCATRIKVSRSGGSAAEQSPLGDSSSVSGESSACRKVAGEAGR